MLSFAKHPPLMTLCADGTDPKQVHKDVMETLATGIPTGSVKTMETLDSFRANLLPHKRQYAMAPTNMISQIQKDMREQTSSSVLSWVLRASEFAMSSSRAKDQKELLRKKDAAVNLTLVCCNCLAHVVLLRCESQETAPSMSAASQGLRCTNRSYRLGDLQGQQCNLIVCHECLTQKTGDSIPKEALWQTCLLYTSPSPRD